MGDLNSDLKGFASRNTARGSSPKWGVLIAGFLKYAGVTGAGTIVILAALFLVQRVIQGGLEEKFRSSLRSSEEEVKSQLRRTEAALTKRLDNQAQIDLDLRNKRDAAYRPLWQQGEQLSRYPPNPRFTYSDARTLALKLRAWYFSDQGGMYLSGEAQVAYRRLQEALGKLPVGHGTEGLWETAQSDYERLHAAFSALRTELTADLQSRVRSPLDQVSSKSPQNEERGLLRGRTSGFPGMSDC